MDSVSMASASAGDVWSIELGEGVTGCRVFVYEHTPSGELVGISADGTYYRLTNPRISKAMKVYPVEPRPMAHGDVHA